MNKWNLKKRIAVFLAVMMFIINCIPVQAEEIGESAYENTESASPVTAVNEGDSEPDTDTADPEGSPSAYFKTSSLKSTPLLTSGSDDESYRNSQVSGNGKGFVFWVDNNTLIISANEIHVFLTAMGEQIESATEHISMKRSEIKQIRFLENGTDYTCTIDSRAFKDFTGLDYFTVNNHITLIRQQAFIGCTSLVSFSVPDNNSHPTYRTSDKPDASLYTKGSHGQLVMVPPGYSGPLEVEDGTTSISANAAEGCKINGILKIPDSVETIETQAFIGCEGISIIKIGNRNSDGTTNSKTTTINASAFKGCSNVTEVYLPAGVTGLSGTPNDFIFENCGNIKYIYYYGVVASQNDYTAMSQRYVALGINNDDIKPGRIILSPYKHAIVSFKQDYGIKTDVNGNPLDPISVSVGKAIKENEEKLGNKLYEIYSDDYWCDGWYLNRSGDFNENTVIPNDITLKMDCKRKFNIEFDSGEGEFSNGKTKANRSVSLNNKLNDWPDDPKADGMKFVGWQIKDRKVIILRDKNDPDAVGFPENDNCRKTRASYTFEGNTNLVAYYIKYETLDFFDADNKKLGSVNVKMNTTLTSENKAEINSLSSNYWKEKYGSDENYVFTGWWSERPVLGQEKGYRLDLDGVLYPKMARKYYLNFKHYLDMTYVYNWDMDGDGIDDVVTYKGKEHNISEGGPYTLEKMPYRPGYEFLGWFNEDGQECSSVIKTIDNTRDRVFTAHWQKLCTITLDRRYNEIYSEEYLNKSENKHLKEMIIVENVVSGSQLMYRSMIPYDTVSGNWKFAGWYDEDGNEITSESRIYNDMTLHAKWLLGCAVEYVVISKGTTSENIFWGKVVPSGSLLPMIPDDFGDNGKPDPLNPAYGYRGYDFVRWLNKKNNKEPDPNFVVTEDITFIAQWKENGEPMYPQHTISFNSMGGSEVPAQTVSEGFLAAKPEDPTWADHKFQGWYTDTDYSKQWDFEKDTVMEDMYLYARWITWTEEDEDRQNGIYWVRLLRKGKASLSEYFQESGLKYSYDKSIVKFSKGKRVVKGKKLGETRITATKVDGSEYPVSVRVFVLKQELQDMFAYAAGEQLDANEALTVSGFPPDKWASSNPGVASIDSKTGIITVRKRGKAKIKAYYNNKAVTATFRSEVPKFAKTFYRLKTGQKKKLKIKRLKKYDIVSWNVLPEGSLSVNSPSWNDIEKAAAEAYTKKGNTTSGNSTSGNRSISMNEVSTNEIMGIGSAEVDGNGKLTALTAGDVIVYAAVYGQIISTKVHIEPPVLRKKTLVMKINKTAKLKLSRTKLKNVEWKSTNDQVAYVDPVSGKIYALKKGRVTLRTHAGGVVNSCSVQVEDTGQMTKGPALSR